MRAMDRGPLGLAGLQKNRHLLAQKQKVG